MTNPVQVQYKSSNVVSFKECPNYLRCILGYRRYSVCRIEYSNIDQAAEKSQIVA